MLEEPLSDSHQNMLTGWLLSIPPLVVSILSLDSHTDSYPPLGVPYCVVVPGLEIRIRCNVTERLAICKYMGRHTPVAHGNRQAKDLSAQS